MLDLEAMIDQLAKTNGVHWYAHVLRNGTNNILRKALDCVVKGARKRGGLKGTWLHTLVEQSRMVGLNQNGANDRIRLRIGANVISSKMV